MAYLFTPTLQVTVDDGAGNLVPAVGYQSYFYANRTTTPVDTWADADETTRNPSPLVHDADGRALVYFTGTVTWELQTTLGDTVPGWPIHDIAAPADAVPPVSDWVPLEQTVAAMPSDAIRVSGDQTALLQPARRVRLHGSGGAPLVGSIVVSTFGGGETTATVRMDYADAVPDPLLGVDVGLLTTLQYAGPVPAMNRDLIVNPHFSASAWPEGTSFDVQSNTPTRYGADGWCFVGEAGEGETGNVRMQQDRYSLNTARDTPRCGSRYGLRLQSSNRVDTIFQTTGTGAQYLGQRLAMAEALPWLGQRGYLEVWGFCFSGTVQLNPWAGIVSTAGTDAVKGTPLVLTAGSGVRRFVAPLTLPAYVELSEPDPAAYLQIGLDLYRGVSNAQVASGQLDAKSYADTDFVLAAVHYVTEEVIGRPLQYLDAMDWLRRQRYFWSSYPDGVAPGTANQHNSGLPIMATLAYRCFTGIRWPVPMYKTPTLKVYAPKAGTISRIEVAADDTLHSDAVTDSSFDEKGLYWLGLLGLTPGMAYRCHLVADGRF